MIRLTPNMPMFWAADWIMMLTKQITAVMTMVFFRPKRSGNHCMTKQGRKLPIHAAALLREGCSIRSSQGSYAFAITPLASLYPTDIFPYYIRTTGVALFRFADTGFGLMASFTMGYAMQNLGWKFYMVNGAYDFIFLACVYFFWVETRGVELEEIAAGFKDLEVIGIEGERTAVTEKAHQI